MTERERPHRVQIRRVKGWRFPANTVSVASPTKWSNPFRVYLDTLGRAVVLSMYSHSLKGWWSPHLPGRYAGIHCAFLRRFPGEIPQEVARRELRGKNLGCYCALDVRCHADLLLEVVNND